MQSAMGNAGSAAAPSRRSPAWACSLIFVLQNTEDVRFQFLFLEFTWSMWLYTIVVALFGALVWFGFGVIRRHRRRKERRDDRRD